MAIFRNEAHVLAEWCQHYISQGAEKIYLINHLSTDNYKDVVEPYRAAGIVELVDAFGEHPQVPAYNSLRSRISKSSRWLLICDLDEFVYGRKGFTIKGYLETLSWRVSEIIIPWKNFGSSSHVRHPKGLIAQNFVFRQSYSSDSIMAQDRQDAFAAQGSHDVCPQSWCKYIVRSSRIRHLAVHYASVWYGRVIDANGCPLRNYNGTLPLSEESLGEADLHLNHYPIQSLDYFKAIKMRRPDVNCASKDSSKTLEYFRQADRNEVFDPELCVAWHSYSLLADISSSASFLS